MILDKEEHRSVFLQLIAASSWKGDSLEVGVEIKKAVMNATVEEEEAKPKDS